MMNKQESKHCSDCRDGEHANYDEDIQLTAIRNNLNGQIVKRAYLCGEHRDMYSDDEYTVARSTLN